MNHNKSLRDAEKQSLSLQEAVQMFLRHKRADKLSPRTIEQYAVVKVLPRQGEVPDRRVL